MAKMVSIMKDISDKQLTEYLQELENMSLEELGRELFSYFDITEESDSGREFHPICISNCRVAYQQTLGALLKEMRERVNA